MKSIVGIASALGIASAIVAGRMRTASGTGIFDIEQNHNNKSSKYKPHQGKQEIARRLARMQKNDGVL